MDAPTPPRFCAPVQRWFTERFAGATEAQRGGWSAIGRGQDTLIMAPTGSGKTLAAFLAGIDTLVRRALEDRLEEGVKIVYISPLKALGADVERNLQAPLRGIEAAAAALGLSFPPIRSAVRSGDSSASERARMIRKPPHLLITTPESLYLLLTSARGRAILAGCEQVIVDEIHALVGNRRGRPPRALARAPRRFVRTSPAAHRSIGDRRAARRGRPLPRRSRSQTARPALAISSTPAAISRSTSASRSRKRPSPRSPRAPPGPTSIQRSRTTSGTTRPP
jgi:Lhr-like helicase